MTKRHCFINSKIKDKHIDEISIDKNEDEWRIPCEMYKGLRKQVTLIFKDLVAQEHEHEQNLSLRIEAPSLSCFSKW